MLQSLLLPHCRNAALAAVLVLGLVAPGAVAQTTGPVVSGAVPIEGYILGAGDVVEVSVLGRDEYKVKVPVQADGTVQLPFLGSVPAANFSVIGLREDVARRLRQGGYYTNPVVAVTIANYASRYVVVLGEVANPGLVTVDRNYRVSEIIARVGGVETTGSDTLVLRRDTGEELKLGIREISSGGDQNDPFVQPGDKLYVAPAETFYIYGQVNAPGNYPVASDMTLRMALARGGGLTPLGSEKRVKLYRKGREIKRIDIGSELVPGDVVVVGERFF